MLRALRLRKASACLKSAWRPADTLELPRRPRVKPGEQGAAGVLCSGTGNLQPPLKVTQMEGWELGLDWFANS